MSSEQIFCIIELSVFTRTDTNLRIGESVDQTLCRSSDAPIERKESSKDEITAAIQPYTESNR